jgi:hypothetical protein
MATDVLKGHGASVFSVEGEAKRGAGNKQNTMLTNTCGFMEAEGTFETVPVCKYSLVLSENQHEPTGDKRRVRKLRTNGRHRRRVTTLPTSGRLQKSDNAAIQWETQKSDKAAN